MAKVVPTRPSTAPGAARFQKKPDEGSDKFATWQDDGHRLHGQAEVIIAKQRHGATGIVPLHFNKETTTFTDVAFDDQVPERY